MVFLVVVWIIKPTPPLSVFCFFTISCCWIGDCWNLIHYCVLGCNSFQANTCFHGNTWVGLPSICVLVLYTVVLAESCLLDSCRYAMVWLFSSGRLRTAEVDNIYTPERAERFNYLHIICVRNLHWGPFQHFSLLSWLSHRGSDWTSWTQTPYANLKSSAHYLNDSYGIYVFKCSVAGSALDFG